MKYLFFLLLLIPAIPSAVLLVLLVYDVNIASDIFDRVANAFAPLMRIFLTFIILIKMPFYFSKKEKYKNAYTKWLTLLFVLFLIIFNPSFGISEVILTKLYASNLVDKIVLQKNFDIILNLKFFLQGSAIGMVVFFSRAILVFVFFFMCIKIEKNLSKNMN